MTEGTHFGRYVLLRKIAVGGMAEIFLAKQTGPGHFERSLVIKRILPHLAQEPRFIGMFLDEAALAAQLSHPHIAQLFDFGEEDGAYYLALELVRGPDLASVIDACGRLGRPPPVEISVRMVTQMLEALAYAHGATDESGEPLNLVHRDVSPQNVLVSATGAVKLIDFGIAKAASAMQHTETGMVKGKFTYMAPEQLRGEQLDGRCDLYATALVLYELLTLRLALQGEGPAAIASALEGRIQPIEELRPDLPADLVAAVGRALRRDRDERFGSCAEFGAALEAVLASQGAMVQSPQIADFLKSLELEAGRPLSPIGPGSGSTEKKAAATGPDGTMISPGTPAPSPRARSGSAAAPLSASPARGFRWAAFALGLLLVGGVAAGWRWYGLRRPIPDVAPAAAADPAPLPPLPTGEAAAAREPEVPVPAPPAKEPPALAEKAARLPERGEPPEVARRERERHHSVKHPGKGSSEGGTPGREGDWAPYQPPDSVAKATTPAPGTTPAPPQPQQAPAGYGYGYNGPAPAYPQQQPYQRPNYYYQANGYCATGYYRSGYYCYRYRGGYYPPPPAGAPPGQGQPPGQ